jgi:hypothetical protein
VGAAAERRKLTTPNQPKHKKGAGIGRYRLASPSPMQFSLESFAALATILGTALSVLALVQSRSWLILTGLPLVGLSIIAGFYARRERLALKAAAITIEGHSIDSLNVANLRRRVNRTLMIQEAHHTARIEGEDLKIEWTYAGYCRAKRESAFEFSIESEHTTLFDRLDCAAYDLGHDPDRTHKISPLLVGTEGLSKKISVPFLEPLRAEQPFRVLLKCTLPNCIKDGFGYYTSTLSFGQNRLRCCTVRIIFVGPCPVWMRVYECSPPQQATLLKSLTPSRQEHGACEYVDVIEDAPGQSARVYAFWRDAI